MTKKAKDEQGDQPIDNLDTTYPLEVEEAEIIEDDDKPKDVRWTKTHADIEEFYLDYLGKHQRYPTKTEIADGIGVCHRTIQRHWGAFNFDTTRDLMAPLKNAFYKKWVNDMMNRVGGVTDKEVRLFRELFDPGHGENNGDAINSDGNIVILNNIPGPQLNQNND